MADHLEQIAQRIAALERQSKALKIIDYYASIQVGAGVPVINASEATFYWDDVHDDLYLNNNGAAGWQLIGGASSIGVHDILSTVHTDTTPAVVVSGDILRGFDPGGGARWQRLGIGANEKILESDGSDVDWVATTNDGAANHNTVLRSSAAGALTLDDFFTIDGGTFGISGNELLTVNAAGTFAFSGINGVTVEDGDWIGNGAASARLGFDSSGGTNYAYFSSCYVGINTATPGKQFDILNSGSGGAGGGLRLNSGAGMRWYAYTATNANGDAIMDMRDNTNTNRVRLHTGADSYLSGGNVGIGTTGPTAQLHVDQSSTTGAIPVLLLDQADLSEEFIEFTSTVGAGNPIDTAALGAYYGKVRVNVTGVGYKYIALYN